MTSLRIGLFCTGLYLLLIALVAFDLAIPSVLLGVVAVIGGLAMVHAALT